MARVEIRKQPIGVLHRESYCKVVIVAKKGMAYHDLKRYIAAPKAQSFNSYQLLIL